MVTVPIAAEAVLHIGALPVTNAQINATLALVVFIVIAIFLNRRLKMRPGKFQNFIEATLEWVMGYFDQVTRDREKSKKFLPLVGTLFFFILISNWMGLLPGTGSIGFWHVVGRTREWIPLLRPAASDLNLTLAMALVSVVSAHVIGGSTLGWWTHINKFFPFNSLVKALKTLSPIKILTALIEFLAGSIEFVGEIAKVASLSLRLFGNVFAGEVLMTVMASLLAYVLPIPFMALELIVGIVQATVFALLTLVYLTVLSMPPHGERHEEHPKKITSHASAIAADS